MVHDRYQNLLGLRVMKVIHLVTARLTHQPGGLESWTLRLAHVLTEAGHRVILYLREAATGSAQNHLSEHLSHKLEVVSLAQQSAIWLEPLKMSSKRAELNKERYRIEALVLANEITRRRQEDSSIHVLCSAYVTTDGYLASLVAEDLQLAHVAFVVGSDFSKGLKSPDERMRFEQVVAQASQIVSLNYHQAAVIQRLFQRASVYTIPVSVPDPYLSAQAKGSDSGQCILVSDCGYSHKKGTQVLLASFSKLYQEGLPVQLKICGKTQVGQEAYWQALRKHASQQFPEAVFLYDYLSDQDVLEMLLRGDIYCSATLGEGSSQARASALCLGLPMVTTDCGEILDLEPQAPHLSRVLPADAKGFYLALRESCLRYLRGELRVEQRFVNQWREYFSPAREAAAIRSLFEAPVIDF